MKSDADRNKIILAFKRAIEATFDDGKWRELGYLTNSIQIIESHPRLLRSLSWGDSDYGGNILYVLPRIIGENLENLKILEDFVGLKKWLFEYDRPLHAELYGANTVSLAEIEQAGKINDVLELNQQVARIKHSITDDPALAIGSAKELLETVLKTILTKYDVSTENEDIPKLLKMVQKLLDIEPQKLPGKDTIFRTLNSLGQIVVGVAEVRNLVGTGHGRSKGPQIDALHAQLIVNATATIATYLLGLLESRTT